MRSKKRQKPGKQIRPDPWARGGGQPEVDPRGNAAVARGLPKPVEETGAVLQAAAAQEEDPSGQSGVLGLVEPIVSRREAPGGRDGVSALLEPIVSRREAPGGRDGLLGLVEPIVFR